MPSTYEQITKQLAKLSLTMEPPQPKAENGKPNPKYGAVVAVYVECLEPFQPWELEAGVKLALENHKFHRWPKPAELRAWCMEAQREFARQRPKPRIAAPKKQREISLEERERVAWKLKILWEWLGCGDPRLKAPDGLQQCKELAARRQKESASRRISQSS